MRWLDNRRARKAAEEAAQREAQERAWWSLCQLMHAGAGGTPIPYPTTADEKGAGR